MKPLIKSVTIFLYYGDDYLLLKRGLHKKIDPGKVNGVGGKLEAGENYIDAAIRETEEETGYKVTPKDMKFCGIIDFEEGYPEEWLTCFFKIKVGSRKIPKKDTSHDGELFWISKNKILKNGFNLVDDLNYCMKDIIEEKKTFFINLKLGKDYKIIAKNIAKI